LVRGAVLISLSSSSIVPGYEAEAATPRLFAANLFVEIIASQVLERDGDAVSVGVVDVGGVPFGSVRQRGAAESALTIDTPFRMASVSKTVTATVVLGLVDDGLLSLEDRPLAALLDRRGVPCDIDGLSDVRVRDLLAHTSGFDARREWFFDEVVDDTEDLLGRFCSKGLRASPGASYRYSNFNYLLLGWLIEDVTGTTYAAAVDSLLLEPNDLDSFVFHTTSSRRPNEPSYQVDPGSNYMELLGAAGAWSASAVDLARFAGILATSGAGDGPLSSRMWAAMRSPTRSSSGGSAWGYGLGVRLFSGGSWGHTGSIESIKALMIGLPDGGSVAVLIDGDRPERTDDLIEIVAEAWWMTHHVGFVIAIPPT
jgi:D-alanyl-D-alanine carboxypeptidase